MKENQNKSKENQIKQKEIQCTQFNRDNESIGERIVEIEPDLPQILKLTGGGAKRNNKKDDKVKNKNNDDNKSQESKHNDIEDNQNDDNEILTELEISVLDFNEEIARIEDTITFPCNLNYFE